MNNPKRQLLEHPLLVFTSVALAIVFVLGAVNAYMQKQRAAAEHLALLRDMEERKKAIADLEKHLSQIESGSGLEREARETMNLKKEGEEVLVIVENEPEKDTKTEATASLWERVKSWFGFD